IWARAALPMEYLSKRRRERCGGGIVGKVAMNAVCDVEHRIEQRPSRRKGWSCIGGEFIAGLHQRRGIDKFRRLDGLRGERRRERVPNRLPWRGREWIVRFPRYHLDACHHLDDEMVVRVGEREEAAAVAEIIDIARLIASGWRRQDAGLDDALIGQGARRQMEDVIGQIHHLL